MSWLDEIAQSLDDQADTDGDPVCVNCGDVKRLISEARKMERVRSFADADLWADVRECSRGCKRKLREILEADE